jgi:hypothetical protein
MTIVGEIGRGIARWCALLIASVVLANCAPSVTEVMRYRLTATLEMDGVIYVASAVQEVQAQTAISYVTPNERGVRSKVRGQAAVMAVPGGHVLLLLKSKGGGDLGTTLIRACGMLSSGEPYATVEAVRQFVGPCRLAHPLVPILVWMDEHLDPSSMKEIEFDGAVVDVGGQHGTLSIAIEASSDPLVFDLDQLMPWLIEQRDPATYEPRTVRAKPRDFLVIGPEFQAETFG